MSVDTIFGGWDVARNPGDPLELLYHRLAAQHVGTREFQPNSGMTQRASEIIPLWELFIRQRPQVILEVGTAQGGTFASWCQLAPDNATLIAIDRDLNDCWPRQGNQVNPMIAPLCQKMTEEGGGLHALKRRGSNQNIVAINGWTTDQAVKDQLSSQLGGRKLDWLFHDASHEADMARVDFEWLWPLIAEGGVFASHDIMPSDDPKCNKKEWWDEAKKSTQHSAVYEFCGSSEDKSMGIGILIK